MFILMVSLYTDGDFCIPKSYKNTGIDKYKYEYKKCWTDIDVAIKESKDILKTMESEIHSTSDYVTEQIHGIFIAAISDFSTKWFKDGNKRVYEYMSGNYDGTEIRFFEIEDDEPMKKIGIARSSDEIAEKLFETSKLENVTHWKMWLTGIEN